MPLRLDSCPIVIVRWPPEGRSIGIRKLYARTATAVLPAEAIELARAELRRRLETPELAVAGRQRARLAKRLEQLKKQHGWGDLTDEEYQAEPDAVKAALADLPDGPAKNPPAAAMARSSSVRAKPPTGS